MEPFVTSLPTIAVATIFCLYDLARRFQKRRERTLRERVAYMLWVLAEDLEQIEAEAKHRVA